MKVKDLKELLEGWDDELELIVASDEEGNDFNELCYVQKSFVNEESQPIHPDDITDDPDDEDWDKTFRGNLTEAIVIWP